MRSFKYKNMRTTKQSENGKTVPTTFNASSKESVYINKNPKFTMTCKSRANGGGKGCTDAGCGKQCCLLPFLITDISKNVYEGNGFDKAFVKGATVKNGSAGGEIIGQVTDIVFPYACCQDPSGVTECSGNTWPLTVQVITTAASGSCANSKYTGGNITINGTDITGGGLETTLEGYEVIGQSKKGAPYRNPILGYRKFLASDLSCCLVENSSGVATRKSAATNNIYKDMHAKYTGKKNFLKLGIQEGSWEEVTDSNNVCYESRIKSGMQPKPGYCCKKNADGTVKITTAVKCQKDISGITCIKRNTYSYDYRQYLHNRSLKSFERSQEKFFTMDPSGNQNTMGIICRLGYSDTHGCNIPNNGTTSGVKNVPILYSKGLCREGHHCNATIGKINPTIYKPNNRKFGKQGAVSSGSRLERLKLDSIRSSNSKCIKGNRCKIITTTNGSQTKTYKVPAGRYFAGKSRFTGWMFNSRHREIVSGIKYKPLPFGIPQLTNKGRSTNSYFLSKETKRNSGEKVKAIWQRPNLKTSRAPGGCYRASPGKDGCPELCKGAGNNSKGCVPGNPCCK